MQTYFATKPQREAFFEICSPCVIFTREWQITVFVRFDAFCCLRSSMSAVAAEQNILEHARH
jgi:hypothetical protein